MMSMLWRPGSRYGWGGIRIEHEQGCVAHSDGDVVIHALCDALLGAAALGDIGLHFPDTSEEYKGIDSKKLLRRTVDLLVREGYRIGMWIVRFVCSDPRSDRISIACGPPWRK